MLSKLKAVLFFVSAGAFMGLLWASGVLAFFHTKSQDIEYGSFWKPVSREEYRSNQRRYPLYGAGVGLVVGVLMIMRRSSEDES